MLPAGTKPLPEPMLTFHQRWFVSFIWEQYHNMCSTDSFQYRWLKRYVYNSCYYHHQIGSIHLSHCYHIFPWLCVWYVCYIIFYYLLHIHSGKNVNSFSLLLCSLWWVQIVIHVLTWRSYSFICTLHHLINIIVQAHVRTLHLWNACQI